MNDTQTFVDKKIKELNTPYRTQDGKCKCGNEVRPDDRYCPWCDQKLERTR